MSGYLATREEPRAFGELRSSWLQTWDSTLEDGPPLLCLPCPQQTWFLRGPCGAPRHGEGTFPFRDLTVTSMNAPSGQTDRKDGWWHAAQSEAGSKQGMYVGCPDRDAQMKGCDSSCFEYVLAGRDLCHCHQELFGLDSESYKNKNMLYSNFLFIYLFISSPSS